MDRFQDDFLRVVERIEQSFEQVEGRFTLLKEERDGLLDQVINLTEEYENLLKQFREREDAEGQLALRVQHLEKECEEQRSIAEQASTTIEGLREELVEKEGIISSLQSDVEELESLQNELERTKGAALQSQSLLQDHESEITSLKQRHESDISAWEGRLSESNKDLADSRSQIEQLVRERDQARSTVESMLIRVRQLETNDVEERASLQKKAESLSRDLEDALDMASSKEVENDELKLRIAQLESQLNELGSQQSLSDEEQTLLIAEVESALLLIDKHLINSDGEIEGRS